MGYIAHHAVIATWMGDYGPQPDLDAFRESLPDDEWRALVVGPITAVVNGYASAVFLPDGSKELWDTSDLGDSLRGRFASLFKAGDVVLVRFGGDEPELASVDDVSDAAD
jgi:hypothetical protein